MRTVKCVSVFDITSAEGRDEFEELINEGAATNRIVNVTEYPMGDGSVLRVVDHLKRTASEGDVPFEYRAPIC